MEACARQRGVPGEQLRQERETHLAAARAWWDSFSATADPERILKILPRSNSPRKGHSTLNGVCLSPRRFR
jgi:hypothetical protein